MTNGTPIRPITFLENGFPTVKLYELAIREGNSKRPIYQMHKWWARRLGSVFRTLLISGFQPAEASGAEFWNKYYDGFSLKNKVIYDPFMGGGTTIVEGLRLGCKVIGCDINPVAWFVTKKEVDPFNENEANNYFRKLEEKVGRLIQSFYETRCPRKHKAEIIYSLWIRRITCKQCKKEHDLFNNFIIRESGSERTIACPKCNHVFTTRSKKHTLSCKNCRRSIRLSNVIIKKGRFRCPDCKTADTVTAAVKRKRTFLASRMFAIQYHCPKCNITGFKSPTSRDFALFERVQMQFRRSKKRLHFPRQRIMVRGRNDIRPVNHGFKYYHELFNPRQLLSLSLLLREIKKIKDRSMREYFLLILSSCLETNNVLCKYETNYGKISALFGVPGYHVPDRYAENNPWGRGRGSFVRSFRKLKRGKRYGISPYENISPSEGSKRNRKISKRYTAENITTEVNVSNFKDIYSDDMPFLACTNSQATSFLDYRSIDAIVTDPPYFDTIIYSELADFFYVWLRLGLKEDYKWFENETSLHQAEMVVNQNSGKNTRHFINSLTKVLEECNRVLKDDGIMIFTFHHSKPWAWLGLRKAIRESGFVVTAAPIIRSEGKTGYREKNISHDVCIVCRKNTFVQLPSETVSELEFIEKAQKTAKELYHLDNLINDPDILTAVMSEYLKSNGAINDSILNSSDQIISQIRSRL